MALLREYLLLIFIISWQFDILISACPKICECKNNSTSCEWCSYNVFIHENKNNFNVEVCCEKDSTLFHWLQNNTNKTFTEVVIQYKSTCNTSKVELDFPQLDTYSITMMNNNITSFRLNINTNNMKEMDFTSNRLEYISNGLFNNFTNLRKLILRRNLIAIIQENSFLRLTKLETLDLSENHLTVLTNVFYPLKNLQHLNLSRNNIQFIHDNYFNNWLLQHLDISHNNLKKVTPGALQQLPNLARLLLTDNPHLGITQLDTQLLVGTGRRLQQIDASRTGLCQVPEAFTHSVRFLSLVGNKITSIRCGDLDSYPLLQSLDFCDNKIISIEDDSLGRLEMLLFLNINRNLLSSVPRSLPDGLEYLSINENSISNLSKPDFKDLKHLRILLLKDNQINYIQDHIFDDLLSLEMLDISNNPIKMLSPSTFDGPLYLRDLRLCHLNTSVPEKDGSFPLSSPESVQMLHLQSSPGLARQLLSDSAALAAFSHLQYLDLRMNNISKIRSDLLFYLGQLKTLRLHGNNINCSTELWLSDWMKWNQSLVSTETCYYSTLESKAEMSKYNCTFPESFTLSESLPPINLYSTEMINKLLRYYGYLNNKTENFENTSKVLRSEKQLKNNNINRSEYHNINNGSLVKDLPDNKVLLHDFLNEISNMKDKGSSKILDQNKIQKDQLNSNRRFLDITSHVSVRIQTEKKDYRQITAVRSEEISGKRLNTPVMTTESKPITRFTENQNIQDADVSEVNTVNPNVRLKYSSHQGVYINYAQNIGMASVISLMLVSVILWASFRLRYKRRQLRALNTDMEDQIEVSNISGGVLW
ncbi:insulin-like growth factor-binding protein complex acid labile subunit [Danaus plexippus]|uniref:insulin-like growth factor-binding protein complex acid labile subunit n=1 Tax=Danaus plexippus TaxID=13037 RepID=UPI002AB24485|nr:insulin-like growth factor-binding protein complex acid labile subunit [Danaus plexippus]